MSVAPSKLAAARFLRALLEAGERCGVDRKQALAAIGATAAEVEDPAGWIPASRMTRAWEIVPALSGDPCFGLHAAETTPLGAFGPLDLATMSSATVSDALERLVRYYAGLGAMAELRMTRDANGARRLATTRIVKTKSDLRHFMENLFALVVTRIRMVALAASRADIDVTVQFVHAVPDRACLAELARIFGPAVSFGAARDELLIGAKTAAMPLFTANPELSPLLEREGERLALRPDAPIAERVRRAIEQTMRDGSVGLDQVARKLRVGPRTVQRLLQSDGTSFADLLDAVRREVALKTLEDGRAVGSELAVALGFSQPSAFYRAFKRWTGTTPSEWKAAPRKSRPR